VPLMSAPVAAGTGTVAEDVVEELLPLPRELVGQGQLFMLQVRGESMVGAGVLDRDYVVVRRQDSADNGDMVAALLSNEESEATVKHFSRQGGHVQLLPDNPAFEPIDGDNAQILGKVVAVLRRLR
jgi:repressor LexA